MIFMIFNILLIMESYEATELDLTTRQLVCYKAKNLIPQAWTTINGRPIPKEDKSSLNKNLFDNEIFFDTQSHIDFERIQERLVHAKGTGAFGYFEVTADVTSYTRAALFSSVGKQTPIAVRFSPANQRTGGTDLVRGVRGMAIKFYTEAGNLDMIGLNFPVFPFKDPLLFEGFSHASRKNPVTNVDDSTMLWDFITNRPESLNFVFWQFSDRGIPDGYRRMPAFSIHTYQLENNQNETYFARMSAMPDLKQKFLTSDEASTIQGTDLDYFTRDLYNAIAKGDYPTWTVNVQMVPLKDVKTYASDIFDVTKELPEKKYPLKPIGKIVLNENPTNQFQDIELLAFCPSNLVDGISGAPDQLFAARRFAYRDTQRYRLGVNFARIGANFPYRSNGINTYNRDGRVPVNQADGPNYYPNSFNGPVLKGRNSQKLFKFIEVTEANNLKQVKELYQKFEADEKKRFIENIVQSLGTAEEFIQEKAVALFKKVDKDLAQQISKKLKSQQKSNGWLTCLAN